LKIGILTFHEIYNPGAYLQTMGTVSLLKSMGHEPVVIDYTAPAHRFSLIKILGGNFRLWFRPRVVAELYGRNRAFKRAQQYFDRTLKLLTHAELEKQHFDAVLIGADIVWDFVAPHLGQDPVYFGEYLNAPLIISFAASCGRVSEETEPPPYVANGLKKLSSISVRDTNTQQMVKRYSERDAEIICDPAFHLDVTSHSVDPMEKEPYLLVYIMHQYASAQYVSQIKSYAKKHRLKTIAVCYRSKWTDDNVICIGPQEWLGYIRNAAAVATNTFHGTIFSVKAGVPFVSELNDAIRLKTRTMIDRLGIADRFFDEQGSVEEILNSSWNVPQVHQRIDLWRKDAESFLEAALKR
jgi:polysaccharide pyruvyl transferase WcaK-like protein